MVKIGKGPQYVMQALLSGDPKQIDEALEFQWEAFRAAVGCYPEDLVCDKHENKYPCSLCEDE